LASASRTNSFSNEGSIVCGGTPFSAPQQQRIAPQHFQTLQRRQLGKGAAHSAADRLLEVG
jgi:hypothetical protein